jgi:hypothetical protein
MQNHITMYAEDIKAVLHQRIEQADIRLLQIVYAMVETYIEQHSIAAPDKDLAGYPVHDEPLTIAELKQKIALAEEQIDQGVYLTLEDLEKEAESWLSGKNTE